MSKYEQELGAIRRSFEQTKAELEEVMRVAELLYETNRRVGAVADYLIKAHGIPDGDREPQSFEMMFRWVQKHVECEGQDGGEVEDENHSSASKDRLAE